MTCSNREWETMGERSIKEKIQEGEETYQSLMNLCPDAVVIIQDTGYRFINPAFTRIFGYTQQDVDGGLSFFQLVQENDKGAVGRRYQDRLDRETTSPDFPHRSRSKRRELDYPVKHLLPSFNMKGGLPTW